MSPIITVSLLAVFSILKSDVVLGIAWDDTRARSLPKEYEPLVAGEEPIDLREIVEDELLLVLPFVNYHDEGQCSGLSSFSVGPEEIVDTELRLFGVQSVALVF